MNIQNQQIMQAKILGTFSGGINTAFPAENIADNEAQDIVNFEYDDDDFLRTRAGILPFGSELFPGRITSIHYYENDLGDVFILATSRNKIYTSPNENPFFTDNTGPLVLPDDTFWQWRNYAGLAIGVNKATTGDNPIKFDGVSLVALAGAPPKAKYIEVWNERVWLVSATDPNVIYGSQLGNPEGWVVGANANDAVILDVSKNDGDRITGIYAFAGKLFVFKRTKIFVIDSVPNTNPYDQNNLIVNLHANNIGCVAPYSIQSVLDDVFFLSDSGVASLTAAPLGELKTSLVSQKVKELRTLRKTTSEISSIVLEEQNQYWLMIPQTISANNVDEIFVLDYRRVQEGLVRWVRFTGKIAGTVATNIYVSGNKKLLIGNRSRIYSYTPALYDFSGVWDVGTWDNSYWDSSNLIELSDALEPVTKRILTKSYNMQTPFERKLFHRFAVNLTLISDTVNLDVRYFFDKNIIQGGSYSLLTEKRVFQHLWDTALWDVGTWDSEVIQEISIVREFKRNARGRKGLNVTFEITNNKINQGFIQKELLIEYVTLSIGRVNNVGVIE